jgi:hypothetical protein
VIIVSNGPEPNRRGRLVSVAAVRERRLEATVKETLTQAGAERHPDAPRTVF